MTFPYLVILSLLNVNISPPPRLPTLTWCRILTYLRIIRFIVSLVGAMDIIDPAYCTETPIEELMMPIMEPDPSTYPW